MEHPTTPADTHIMAYTRTSCDGFVNAYMLSWGVAFPFSHLATADELLHEFGIPMGGVVVNMLIDQEVVGEGTPAFVKNRVAMQQSYMEEIWRTFPDVRAIVPLFETEVRGVEMLQRTAQYLFARD